MLNTKHQKKYRLLTFYRFFFFFEKRFLIKQLIRIHILFHIQMGPSVDITRHVDPRREGGGWGATPICSSYVGSGPASTVHLKKISRISCTPKNILHTPPPPRKKIILLKTKKKKKKWKF